MQNAKYTFFIILKPKEIKETEKVETDKYYVDYVELCHICMHNYKLFSCKKEGKVRELVVVNIIPKL